MVDRGARGFANPAVLPRGRILPLARRPSAVPALFLGLVALLAAAALAYAIRLADLPWVAAWLLLGVGAAGLVGVARMVAGGGFIAFLLGLLGLLAPAAVVTAALDVALVGEERAGPVAEAGGGLLVASRRFTDAWPIPSRGQAVVVSRRRLQRREATQDFAVAPVVPFSWTTEQPVPAWAVAPGRAAPEGWSQRAGRLVMLLPDERVDEAVEAGARAARLTSRPDAPVGLWVTGEDDPARDAATMLGAVLLGGMAAWGLAVILATRRGALG